MDRLNLLKISAVIALALALLPGSANSQQKSMKDQLVGAWVFVSALDIHPDGKTGDRWGKDAKGVFIFDASGRFAQFIMRADLPKIAAGNPMKGTPEENNAILSNLVATFGTYTVSEADKLLVTTVEGGVYPNQFGVAQKRIVVSLTVDELKYTNPATSTGTRAEATWRRAK